MTSHLFKKKNLFVLSSTPARRAQIIDLRHARQAYYLEYRSNDRRRTPFFASSGERTSAGAHAGAASNFSTSCDVRALSVHDERNGNE